MPNKRIEQDWAGLADLNPVGAIQWPGSQHGWLVPPVGFSRGHASHQQCGHRGMKPLRCCPGWEELYCIQSSTHSEQTLALGQRDEFLDRPKGAAKTQKFLFWRSTLILMKSFIIRIFKKLSNKCYKKMISCLKVNYADLLHFFFRDMR